MARALRQETCNPLPDVVRELYAVFGEPNPRLAWLHLHFHPVWERWVLYQVVPHQATNGLVRRDREEGAPLLNLERGLLDIGQWQVYQETGCYASPFWVVQGDHGGHRRRFWPYERALAEMHGLPGELPAPGDLPYAEVDRRTFDQLRQVDQAGKWNKILEYCDRNQQMLDEQEKEGQREVKRQLWKWVQDQTANVFESMTRKDMAAAVDELPHGMGRGKGIDYDAHLERKLTLI